MSMDGVQVGMTFETRRGMQKRYTNTRRCLGCGEDSRLCDCSVDMHGNAVAREGCDRCSCGSKYWENDQCVDCQTPVTDSSVDRT